jgi:hypothetical protein
MKKNESQQDFLRRARTTLKVDTAGLAKLVGVALTTMRGYLLPERSAPHRKLPEPTRRLIRRILAERRAKR